MVKPTINYQLHDPELTDLGFKQCSELAKYLQNDVPLVKDIGLIVVSPMRRTIQTAKTALGWLMDQGVPVVLRAEWQENAAKPCDTGSPIPVVSQEFPEFNWAAVDPEYPSKKGIYAFSEYGLTTRGNFAREWLKNRPEKVIAVVSHAGFLRVGVSHRRFENADFRIFDFVKEADSLELVEWEMTEAKGGGLGKSEKGVFPAEPNDWAPGPPEEVVTEEPA